MGVCEVCGDALRTSSRGLQQGGDKLAVRCRCGGCGGGCGRGGVWVCVRCVGTPCAQAAEACSRAGGQTCRALHAHIWR
eukprot:365893-Chlamydomonas_euryale.AAC.3